MNIEEYFADALEFGNILWKLGMTEGEEREVWKEKIRHLSYLKNIRSFQKLPSTDQNSNWLSTMRGEYFLNPAVPCRTQEYQPGTIYASGYHTHDYYELVFVLKGHYKQFINGVCYELNEGQICLLPPGILHREELQGWEERVLFCGIGIAFFEGELSSRLNKQILEVIRLRRNDQFSHEFFIFDMSGNQQIQTCLSRIMEEDYQKEAGHHMVIKGYLMRLMKLLSNETTWECFKQTKKETEDSLIKEILTYMEKHLATVTKNELGEFFHFNPDYLGRFLLRKTGNTYSENLNNMRMERAIKLLQTDLGVNAVIRQLGFSNKGHFNKMFKKYYGMLPGEYKNQNLT